MGRVALGVWLISIASAYLGSEWGPVGIRHAIPFGVVVLVGMLLMMERRVPVGVALLAAVIPAPLLTGQPWPILVWTMTVLWMLGLTCAPPRPPASVWVSLREAARRTGRTPDEMRFAVVMGEIESRTTPDETSYEVRMADR